MSENNSIPSKIKSTLSHCRDVSDVVDIENAKIDQFHDRIGDKLDEYSKVLSGVNDKLQKIRSLQQLIEYFKILQEIEDVK